MRVEQDQRIANSKREVTFQNDLNSSEEIHIVKSDGQMLFPLRKGGEENSHKLDCLDHCR